MTRIIRGNISRNHKRKMRSFSFSSFNSNFFQHKIKAFDSSYRDRRNRKKINFRRLWITRINALIRKFKIFNSYSKFINNLYTNRVILNRKILSQVSILNKNCLKKFTINKTLGI